jgi:hypothetical protein
MRPVFHIGICLVEKLCSVPFIVELLKGGTIAELQVLTIIKKVLVIFSDL